MPARGKRSGVELFTLEREGSDADGNPTGLLMWGQAGAYNAVDDRFALAALCADKGIVRPALLTAGSGLTVNVAAGWLAIASCEDGTRAAVGSRQTHQVQLPAGGQAGITAYLWCDVDPDAGSWTLRVLSLAETIGRNGVSLARIDIPAGANLATQAAFSQMVPTLQPRSEATWREANTTATVDLTPRWPVAPHQIQPHRTWRIDAWGGGFMGTSLANPHFETVSGSQLLGSGTGPDAQSSGLVTFDISGGASDVGDFSTRNEFNWMARCILSINPGKDLIRLACQVNITNATRLAKRYRNSISAVRQVSLTRLWQADWYWVCLRGGWSANVTSQTIVCTGSTFEMMEPLR